ncbi:Hypothetical protein BCD_1830 (plasmid) [Borrelia crocidurae DOU]|uniref:BBH37-like helical domain-containing protein n=1 Tax=Borrelia crocidurae DOU TaxID=1293575 RepID=W5SS98_9SPIR|nr:P12 family lipoprotein [Borrelia crocidurae]AHH07896.1 Hypothetical protein BCD_1830 [Borrelia crocidurae DOU]
MNKSVLFLCMLILLCLLSCDVNALNNLLGEVREKFLDKNKNNKDLFHIQKNQKEIGEQQDGVISVLEEEVIEIQQVVQVKPINEVIPPVFQQGYSYYLQEEAIVIDSERLVPYTKEEKEANKAIENVKNVLKSIDSEFSQFIEDALKLKSESEKLEADFYAIVKKVQDEKALLMSSYKENIGKVRKLTRLQNQLKINLDLETLMSQVETILSEFRSAEYFFEKAQKTLKEAITKRLENEAFKGRFFRRVNNSNLLVQLSIESRRNAENSLEQLTSYSLELAEAKIKKDEIKNLIEIAKSSLSSLER